MGIIYPDNSNRANRVTQLADNIGTIQQQVKETVDDIKFKDERAAKVLDTIWKNAGYKTLDEYVAAAVAQLSDEDREMYHDMKRNLEKQDDSVDLAMKIGSGMIAVGVFAGLTGVVLTKLVSSNMFRVATAAIGRGIVKLLSGLSSGNLLIKAGGKSLGALLKSGKFAQTFTKAMRLLKTVSKVLSVLGIVLDSVLLIYEAIEGDKQRTELQKGIKELSARRLTVKKIQQSVRTASNFAGDAKSVLDRKGDLDEFVRDGLITQEVADKKLREKMEPIEADVVKAMETNTDEAAWKLLGEQDELSGIAWRNEDPSLEWALQWIEDNQDE